MELAAHASVIAAKAVVDKAKLDLGFTKIRSPIDGVAGIAKAQIGNLVGPGVTEELTTVSTVNPIKVYVSISEQEYLQAAERQKRNERQPTKNIVMFLADGSEYPYHGSFYLADRQVDPKTGTIRVAAIFDNPSNILRPGQFARVRATVATKKGALLVPQQSLAELQGSYFVAVVGPDNKVQNRPVKVSETIDDLQVVDKGLKPGERVVVEGIQKAKPGTPVTPTPYYAEKTGNIPGEKLASAKTEATEGQRK
jgi:membrane fusion protein (multidrug efflux system)